MITSLQLENFKAFGSRVQIPLAPITLIFGENSAGKSSVLHALSLLKQTRESREAGALLLPRSENGVVDLGSFQELLHNHDLERQLSIRVETSSTDPTGPLRRPLPVGHSVSLEFVFHRPSLDDEISLKKLDMYVRIDSEHEEIHVASFEIMSESDLPHDFRKNLFRDLTRPPFMREQRMSRSAVRIGKCTWITNDEIIWRPLYENGQAVRKRVLNYLVKAQKDPDIRSSQDSLFVDDAETKNERSIQDMLSEAINFYSRHSDLNEYVQWMISNQLNTFMAFDGFIPSFIPRRLNSSVEERFLDFRVRRIYEESYFDPCKTAILAGRRLEQSLEALFPLGPYRRPPQRWYIFTGTSPRDVGYEGDLLPDLLYRNPQLVEEANSWLEKLNLGYVLKVRPMGPRLKDLFEVRLADTRREKRVEVGLSDVGFGISQLLPLIVQSLASHNHLITIEQPEIHVHPRLQADLGDLLATSIQPPYENRFIIETHSEHLILRMQKLVRNGLLDPSHVSVIYISRKSRGAELHQLRLDEDGDFVDPWPDGFFPERLRELI